MVRCVTQLAVLLFSPTIQFRYAPLATVSAFWANMRHIKPSSWSEDDTRKWSAVIAAGKAGDFAQYSVLLVI